MKRFRISDFGLWAVILLTLPGCIYSTHNALPSHIKTVAVPVFKNKTYVTDYTRNIEVEVTESVRQAFIHGGELKITGREDADLILEGDVTSYSRDILRVDRVGEPAQVRVELRARISAYDVKEAKYLLKNHLVANSEKIRDSGLYNIRRGEYEDLGRQNAVEDLGRLISQAVTEMWPAPAPKKNDVK